MPFEAPKNTKINLTYTTKPILVTAEIPGVNFVGKHPLFLDEFNMTRRGLPASMYHPELVTTHNKFGKDSSAGKKPSRTPAEEAEMLVLRDDIEHYVQYVLKIPKVEATKGSSAFSKKADNWANAVARIWGEIEGMGHTDQNEREELRQEALNDLYSHREMSERADTYGERLQSALESLDQLYSGSYGDTLLEEYYRNNPDERPENYYKSDSWDT